MTGIRDGTSPATGKWRSRAQIAGCRFSFCFATVIGGYIIGLTIAYLAQAPNIAPEWRLLIITGFCGGLTTFSTFSAEVVTRLQEGHLIWAMGAIAIHVTGSLIMTFPGLATVSC